MGFCINRVQWPMLQEKKNNPEKELEGCEEMIPNGEKGHAGYHKLLERGQKEAD